MSWCTVSPVLNPSARQFTIILPVGGLLAVIMAAWFGDAGMPRSDQLRSTAAAAGYLLLVAACAGVAAMASVQFWKLLFRPRSAFHFVELDKAFGKYVNHVLGLAPPDAKTPSESADESDRGRLLDNPTEVVMGQVRAGADYLLVNPAGFHDAVYRLAGPAGKTAVGKYLEAVAKYEASEKMDKQAATTASEALVAVRFFVDQRLNVVHSTIRERWRLRVRLIGAVVAAVAGGLVAVLVGLHPLVSLSVVGTAAIWGGFFSWFARDLVSLVERGRR
jgi:hypothetical protein